MTEKSVQVLYKYLISNNDLQNYAVKCLTIWTLNLHLNILVLLSYTSYSFLRVLYITNASKRGRNRNDSFGAF